MILRNVLNDKDCKKLFMFVCLLSVMAFTEVLYGWWTSSLGIYI